jgi:hypothetical protein
MFKNCCPENTFLAIADGTGHHTIVASDTGGKSV